jgi:hypothetical protein
VVKVWNNDKMTITVRDPVGLIVEEVAGSDPLPPHPNPEWKALFWPPKTPHAFPDTSIGSGRMPFPSEPRETPH